MKFCETFAPIEAFLHTRKAEFFSADEIFGKKSHFYSSLQRTEPPKLYTLSPFLMNPLTLSRLLFTYFAFCGQARKHAPQRIHSFSVISACSFLKAIDFTWTASDTFITVFRVCFFKLYNTHTL